MKISSCPRLSLLLFLFYELTTIAMGVGNLSRTRTDKFDEELKIMMKSVVGGSNSTQTARSGLILKTPLTSQNNEILEEVLRKNSGDILGTQQNDKTSDFVFRLTLPAVGQSGETSKEGRENHREKVLQQQQEFISRMKEVAPDMIVTGQTQMVLNAVFVKGTKSSLSEVAKEKTINHIAPVGRYKLLSEVVPYIGGSIVQSRGYTGEGVKVAILDSGIDYTHANLGGDGTIDAYTEAYGEDGDDPRNKDRDGLFPTEKVVEGYDFVGEKWPDGDVEPDDDPIDFKNHGTHIADIIAGTNGVAPGAKLLAVKVCSAIDSECNGRALIQGMEYAVEQEVDIINVSLGADFGQPFDDDLSYSVRSATSLGILTVAAGGNCKDIPYCVGTPATEPTALAVAQTEAPSAKRYFVTIGDVDYLAAFFVWSRLPESLISGPVVYGDGSSNTLGCDEFNVSFNGKIVMVDRGGCFFSSKVQNVEKAGGLAAIVANSAPGPPFSGSFGEGDFPTIPAFMISLKDGNFIKDLIPDNIECIIDPNVFISLAGMTAPSSPRGPDMSYNAIKPEIAAPGGILSALVGTGTLESTFGGTSSSAPVVAGAAALLKELCRDCSPLKIKALLMNNAFREVISDTTDSLAKITRVGAGELRVDKAFDATFWAYSPDDLQPSLSLGLVDAAKDMTIRRKIRIVNLSSVDQNLIVIPEFRLDAEPLSGALQIETEQNGNPIEEVNLIRNGDVLLDILFHLDADAVPANFMNSGFESINPTSLSSNEIDGYLLLINGDGEEVALPWHILVRRAASVEVERNTLVSAFPDTIKIKNNGAGTAQIDAFDLVAISDEKERGAFGQAMPTPDVRAVGVRTSLNEDCSSSFLLEFAVSTWDRQRHLRPVGLYFILDMDQDGTPDYEVLNSAIIENIEFTTVIDIKGDEGSALSPVEHSTNTGNTVMKVCGEQLGLSLSDLLSANQKIDVRLFAEDVAFGGPGDEVGNFTIIPFGERFTPDEGIGWWTFRNAQGSSLDLSPGQEGTLDIFDLGPLYFLNSESYGMMLFTNGDRGEGNRGAATEETEVVLLLASDTDLPKSLRLQQPTTNTPKRKQRRQRRKERIKNKPASSPTESPTLSPKDSTASEAEEIQPRKGVKKRRERRNNRKNENKTKMPSKTASPISDSGFRRKRGNNGRDKNELP